MQLIKTYEGVLDPVGATGVRPSSYGVAGNVTVYPAKVDFINRLIADFLKNDCGVNAAYEMRGGDTASFLWVNGAPFLFAPPTASVNYFNFYGPFYAPALVTGSGTSFFVRATAGDYSFRLAFAGNPKTGFALRATPYYATNSFAATLCFRFARATNLLNGRDALVWVYNNTVTNTIVSDANGIDLLEDGSMDAGSFSSPAITYLPSLNGKAVNKTSAAGKFPLAPLLIGPWKLSGIYQHVRGFGLPSALGSHVDAQCEVEISGRRFINTTYESVAAGYINLGLIEVDD